MADSINPYEGKISSSNFLPRFYKTDTNKKFLQATLDQLIVQGTVKKINGYVGRQNSKATLGKDIFLAAPTNSRQNYQLEPGMVIKDTLGNKWTFYYHLARISHKERENWGQKLPKSILHKYSGS